METGNRNQRMARECFFSTYEVCSVISPKQTTGISLFAYAGLKLWPRIMEIQFFVLDGNYFHTAFSKQSSEQLLKSISTLMLFIRGIEKLKTF